MTRTRTSLARLGLTAPRAESTLTGLGWWAGDGPADGADVVMWALARSPDPELALRVVERLYEAVDDRPVHEPALLAWHPKSGGLEVL